MGTRYVPSESVPPGSIAGSSGSSISGMTGTTTGSTNTGTTNNSSSSTTKAAKTQVTNLQPNAALKVFAGIAAKTKLNEKYEEHGKVPTSSRNGRNVPMCVAYHVRGTCYSNCPRKSDHTVHTAAEDKLLHDWCTKALAA